MAGHTQSSDAQGWAWLERARELRVAAVVDGKPLLRTMHAVVVDGTLVLHGAPKGRKRAWEGSPATAAAEEVVARIPSWMRHPEKACPATTYYRSVQVEGHIQPLVDVDLRAAALQRMMEVFQPEGGYRPLSAQDPLYSSVIGGLAMWSIVVERMSAVAKLGQHLRESAMSKILAGLWRRGGPGDLEAIGALTEAHPASPTFRALPDGLVARCVPTADHLAQVLPWLARTYWNQGIPEPILRGAHQHGAWVGLEADGCLVASARAISDHHKRAWVYDVVVDPARRRHGLGEQLMSLLLDHPYLRDVHTVSLVTRDAEPFYMRLGFAPATRWGSGPARRVSMTRRHALRS